MNENFLKLMGKEGLSIFNDESVRLLRAMQRKYTDHHEFFTQLTLLYQGQRMTAEQEKAGETIALIEEVNEQINKVLNIRNLPTKEEIQKLFSLTEKIDLNIKIFQNKGPEQLSKAMQKRIEEAENKTGMNLENLGKSAAMIQGRMGKLTKTVTSPILKGIGGIGGAIAGTMLGPLGILATAGMDLYKNYRERKITAENKALSGTLLLEKEQTREAQMGMFENLFGGKAVIPKTIEERSRKYIGGFNPFADIKETIGANTGVRGVGNLNLGTALFTFFQFDAYKAGWTRDLLNAVKQLVGTGIKIGGEGKQGINLLPNLGDLVNILKRIAPALMGVAGIGMGLWDAFKAQSVARDRGWLGPVGKELIGGQKWAAGIGGFLGGTGYGLGEKGSTWADIAKNASWGIGKGALIGSMFGPLGTLIGSGVGLGTSLIGGRRIASGIQATTRWLTGEKTPEQLEKQLGVHSTVARALELQRQGMSIKESVAAVAAEQGGKEVTSSALLTFGEEAKQGFGNVVNSIEKMSAKLDKNSGVSFSSGNFFATNIGDPLVEALSLGSLDTE
jgi:hypothetical protein